MEELASKAHRREFGLRSEEELRVWIFEKRDEARRAARRWPKLDGPEPGITLIEMDRLEAFLDGNEEV